MKKLFALLIACAVLFSAVALTSCSSSDKKSEEEKTAETEAAKVEINNTEYPNLTFTTVGELKASGTEYDFIKMNSSYLTDDMAVCQVKADAEGDITIPAKCDGVEIIAAVSETQNGEKITSVTVEDGVVYLENCYNEKSAIASVTLSSSVKAIYHSFNAASDLTEVSFTDGVKYIVDSFNDCEKLAKADANSYLYGIQNAFLNDAKLTDFTFNGSVQKIDGSFNSSGIEEVHFVENIHDINESYNECASLGSLTVDQIANVFKKSFCKCPALTTVKFAQGAESIQLSFNDNDTLENVDFGGEPPVSDSFENCPKYTLPEAESE